MTHTTQLTPREMIIQRRKTADKQLKTRQLIAIIVAIVFLLTTFIALFIAEQFHTEYNENDYFLNDNEDYLDYCRDQRQLWFTVAGITASIGILAAILESLYDHFSSFCCYYRCKNCGHIHVPSQDMLQGSVSTLNKRYIQCPHCATKNWQQRIPDFY